MVRERGCPQDLHRPVRNTTHSCSMTSNICDCTRMETEEGAEGRGAVPVKLKELLSGHFRAVASFYVTKNVNRRTNNQISATRN